MAELFCYDVYDSTGNIDFFYDVAGQLVSQSFFCHSDDVFLGLILGNIDGHTHLAIDLNTDLNNALYSLLFLKFRPCCLIQSALESGSLPQFLSNMRSHGVQQSKQCLLFAPGNRVLLIELVDQGHHSRDGGVVLQVLEIAADLLDGLVHLGLQICAVAFLVCQDIL